MPFFLGNMEIYDISLYIICHYGMLVTRSFFKIFGDKKNAGRELLIVNTEQNNITI